jgi:3-hydroxy-D-aspartate aldolase
MQIATNRNPNEALVGQPGSRHLMGTPALVLDLDVLDRNIASMATFAQARGYGLRPPAKIHKSVEIARRQVAAGALGLCCATLAEAEVMVDGGIPGVMLFTSVVTEAKLGRLSALNGRTPDGLLVVADDPRNVSQLGEAARRSGRPMRVLVDFEVGGGRTGVADPATAVELARQIAATDGLVYAGVQGYVGNHQANPDFEARRAESQRLMAPLIDLVARLRDEGLPPEIVSGGGTGTQDIDHEFRVLTELQPGTYIFMDVNYRGAELRRDEPFPFAPALSVRTTVISNAQRGFAITDGGTKEVNGLFGPLAPVILNGAPNGATYSIVGDDMGRIDFARAEDGLDLGAVVNIQPPHCYQTVIMYGCYHVVRGDDLVDIWPLDALPSW